ncbi:MAG: hypothetical protein HGA24_05985, partial [Candidatus Aminicenantes bacterium]|nr:hypothetical protein [Candidatus Aminicenantes bacterium]
MRAITRTAALGLLILGISACTQAPKADYPAEPVPFTDVHLTDVFWAPRLETNRTVTIPHNFKQSEETGRVKNFDLAGAALEGATDGKYCSPETSGTYFIGPAFTSRPLPVFSLITDANNLFGFTSGIYVPGKTYADSPEGYGANKWGKPYANYHLDSDTQAWERPIHLELFETNQTLSAVSLLMGSSMHGGGTRAIPQKTLYMMAREAEYGTGIVNYALFPGETASVYKRFLLRNSGNDWYGPDTAGVA